MPNVFWEFPSVIHRLLPLQPPWFLEGLSRDGMFDKQRNRIKITGSNGSNYVKLVKLVHVKALYEL